MPGLQTIDGLRQLEEVAEEERVPVSEPRVAHQAYRDVFLPARAEDEVPKLFTDAERDAELEFSHSA